MKQDKSIAFIICYFGCNLPWYFDYFIHSCGYNPTIDFFIITDDTSYSKALPVNVKLIYKTLYDVNLLATEKLGFPVNIKFGYKLCDFKPAYGHIFSYLLKEYDFWGHTDLDVIFGNIREFMTDELLEAHDLISVRPDWLTGCFLLYKNVPKTNLLFTHSKDYKKVFSSDNHYCFDETNFAHDAFSEGRSYQEIDTEIESMMHVVKKMEAANYIKPFFDLFIIEGLPGKLKWKNGRMYYRGKYEILLYHMIYFKKRYMPKTSRLNIPGSFSISPANIYHHTRPKTLSNEF
ncbi:MAG: hypothetical protein JWP37_2731 [Mucilaginibacter sp.]|nr:hypothetical protein [Mucilaginibacter sp.]